MADVCLQCRFETTSRDPATASALRMISKGSIGDACVVGWVGCVLTAWVLSCGVTGVPAEGRLVGGTLELVVEGVYAYDPIEVSTCGKIFPLSSARA